MNEKPLERLNYFNGQRLQAADFKLEQDYHMRVRRWLNRSLYTAGIASGLEVYAIEGAPCVRVMPGLAIDVLGREIILLEEQTVPIVGQHNASGACMGPYLTIRYQEDIIEQSTDSCVPNGNSSNKAAQTGPARILADPVLELNTSLPNENSGKVALACIALAKGCGSIDFVDTGVRKYIGDASAAKVKQYALEGTREVASIPAVAGGTPVTVKGTVLFHIRGRQPNSVTLYLKSRQFSPLHYTELGQHTHTVSVTGGTGESNPVLNSTATSHHHSHGSLAAVNDATSEHENHTLEARKGYIGSSRLPDPFKEDSENKGRAAFFVIERDWAVAITFNGVPGGLSIGIAPEQDSTVEDILDDTNGKIKGGAHGHSISGDTEDNGPDLRHTHSLSGSGGSGVTGSADAQNASVAARLGATFQHFYALQVAVDGTDKTPAVLQQIAAAVGTNDAAAWTRLGDGTATHPLAAEDKDAVGIKVHYLPGVTLNEGEHSIDFSVDLHNGLANGGLVQFNLYVE